MDFKDKIKFNREKLGYTLEELSKLVGVSAPTIQRYESGEIKNVRRDKIAKLAKALDVTPSYLMGWEDENSEPILENIPGIITPIKMKRIPILGTISCGNPIFADQNYDGYFMIDTNLPEADFVLKANGDSMIEANIFEGDFVFFRKQRDVDNGTIAAVLIDEEATLKRVNKSNDVIILQPCNKNYEPLIYSKDDDKNIVILGQMVGVYSNRSK
ncbi:LexA family protein [Peptoniphilus genitalis]|uniref:LexA family protein n=1 Tax=Peptoniphilus genitalis TaxID=3036303 RepID=UPI0024AE1D93|nr:S24 family peptidase [Peptoniphilus sp. Marseille-Q7072]